MKHFFSILLLCLIFQNVLTAKRSLKMRMAKAAQAMKIISDRKEKLRKLEATDVSEDTESGSTDTTVQTTVPPENYTDTSPDDAPESTNATASNSIVNATKPVSTLPKTMDQKKASVQVTKFHGFQRPTTRGAGTVRFGVFFYFFGRPIVKYIVIRLRIVYSRGLRNLQDTALAESVRTDCTIADESLAGKVLDSEDGENVNYNCNANATAGDASTANFTLNTDVPLTMVNSNGTVESLNFTEVNFNGDAANEATSLQTNDVKLSGAKATLANTIASVDKYYLILSGELKNSRRRFRNLDLGSTDTITMTINDNDNVAKTYDCSFTKGSPSELKCDTSSDPITTSAEKIHLSTGNSTDGTLLTVEMQDYDTNTTANIKTQGSSNRYIYNKSSSGLSGGAIAGIVIACVVALAAASIAAVMLRKPTPPVDNTTIVDLKTETI